MLTRYLYYLHRLRNNLHMDRLELQKIQNQKLRAIVKHAYEHVPFYHRKFNEAGVKPSDVRSAEDLPKLPKTTKAEIQAMPQSDTVADNICISDCVIGFTSGSTGVPLTLAIDKKAEDFRLALWARAYMENGLMPWDKMAIMKEPHHFQKHKRWMQRLGIVRRKEISVFDAVQEQKRLIESYQPDVLKGYSSSLAILADLCRDRKHCINPRIIFSGAELLPETDRKMIQAAFACDVIDYYGCTEFSLLAWECQDQMGYHMNADSTVLEVVNNGETVAPGELGELICTSLTNHAMPLIRYRLGDRGAFTEEPCTCGRPLPLLKMLEGRMDDFLTAQDGRIISPIIFTPYPFRSVKDIKQFKVIQQNREKMTIQLVVKNSFPEDDQVFEDASIEIKRVFGDGIQVDFQILEGFEKDPTGKIRQIVSNVPVPWR